MSDIRRYRIVTDGGGSDYYPQHDDEGEWCRAVDVEALEQDQDFLTVDEVFGSDMIDAYVRLKRAEIEEVERVPHPVEFQLYYSG